MKSSKRITDDQLTAILSDALRHVAERIVDECRPAVAVPSVAPQAIAPAAPAAIVAGPPPGPAKWRYRDWRAALRALKRQEENSKPGPRPWAPVGGRLEPHEWRVLVAIRATYPISAYDLGAITGLTPDEVKAATKALWRADYVIRIGYSSGEKWLPRMPDD